MAELERIRNLSCKIFKKVFHFEDYIYSSADCKTRTVYEKFLVLIKRITNTHLVFVLFLIILYIPVPLFRDPYYVKKGNETLIIHQMPLGLWTPFDSYRWVAYVVTATCGAYMGFFFIGTDAICYCFILFGVCQLEILRNYILNFNQYALKHSETHGVSLDDSYRILQKKNIKMHQDIIAYVKEFNNTFRNIMLLDLLPSSVQLAAMVYQIVTNMAMIQVVLIGQFIFTQISRIFMYCNSSNYLTQKGQEIGTAWYNVDWTDIPQDVQKNIVLCVMRAQNPLYISIGKFHNISLETVLTIIQRTYSWALLLNTSI